MYRYTRRQPPTRAQDDLGARKVGDHGLEHAGAPTVARGARSGRQDRPSAARARAGREGLARGAGGSRLWLACGSPTSRERRENTLLLFFLPMK
eukprot:scaffold171054_cov33-Tisochrysis_lutea.AAC.1